VTLKLAWTIARAEIRLGRLAIGIVAVGIVGAVLGIATQSGPYPVVPTPVRNLVYLGPALMAAAALVAARPAATGMARELFLCGIAPRKRRLATALAVAVASVAGWLCASVITTVTAMAWSWAQRDSVTALGHAEGGVAWWLVVGLASVGLLALVGTACGVLSRSAVGAITVVAVATGIPLILLMFGAFPPALWLRSMFPTGAIYGMFEQLDGVRGSAAFRWGVPAGYLLLATWVLAIGRLTPNPRERFDPATTSPATSALPPQRTRLAAVAPWLLLAICTAAVGVVTPPRIARAVPWWLHGTWLSDLASGRASEPVARAYVSAVLAGDRTRELRLVRGSRDAVLDPVLRMRVRRAGRVRDVRYIYNASALPGTVLVTLGGRATARVDLTICSVRTRAGWRVMRTSAAGRC
jgi:hypothetical protein